MYTCVLLPMEVVGLTREKQSENRHKVVLYYMLDYLWVVYQVYFLYTLLKVVNHYDLSVKSMSVVFQNELICELQPVSIFYV